MKNIATAVRENADLVPPAGMGSLYLRPILFGSGPGLGVSPSPEYHFMTYVSPVGNGGTKAAGNYAPCFKYQQQAKAEGYTDIIYMDNWTGERVEEVACANLFVVEKDRICTPPLGMILPGVTRMTVMQLIEEIGDKELGGRKLYEGDVTLENIANAEEIFCTGTAAVISPISHVGESDPNSKHKYDFIPMGPVTTKLREILTGIQAERLPDTHNWLRDPFDEDAFCA
eukprot:g8320.t1